MAYYYTEPSHTFSEYLLVSGYSLNKCIPDRVSLKTPEVKFKEGEECSLTMNIPMVSAVSIVEGGVHDVQLKDSSNQIRHLLFP